MRICHYCGRRPGRFYIPENIASWLDIDSEFYCFNLVKSFRSIVNITTLQF